MKAVILAAGYATRLYPITLDKPKTLLDIGKKKILDFIIEKIPTEIRDIYIITNSKFYPLLKEWHEKNSRINVNIINDGTISDENKLGAIRDMHLAVSKSKEDDVLVLASDNLFDFELDNAFNLFKKSNKDVIIVHDIQDKGKASRFGVLSIDKNGRIIKFEEKPNEPETTLISTGLYFFTKDSLKLLPGYISETKDNNGPGYFVKWLINKKEVYACKTEGKWYDIGNLDTYNEAVRYFDKKTL